jgi:hypothetical protein
MDANDSEHIFTPRTYNRGASKPEGIIKESTRGQRTDRPDTTPSFNRDRMTWRFLGEDSHYVERPPTPPRKTTPRKTTTRKGGKRGKYNKTMRK